MPPPATIPLPRNPTLLGVPFARLTLPAAVDAIGTMIAGGGPRQVVTANVDFLVQAQADPELRRILRTADLVLCDGMPLVWASRLRGTPLPGRVAGADLVPALLRRAEERGHRVFLLGAGPGVAAAAAARVRARHPRLREIGHASPPAGTLFELGAPGLLARIRAARPDLLLVAFGCPKQEKWIARHREELGVPVSIGIGATLDFLAGRVRRAPAWVGRCGFEWLFRLAQEPRRLARRYARDLVQFPALLAADAWRRTS